MDRDLRNVASSSRAIKKKKKRKEWTQMFPVPSNLVESYQGVLSPKLTFRCGEFDKKWRIKVEKFNGQYFFTDGWKEFEEEVGLKSREFLMYRNASSKRRALLGKNKEKRRKASGNAHGTKISSLNENNGSAVEKNLSFLKVVKMYHMHALGIPSDFARSTGILKGDEIKIKNSEGREWPVHVRTKNSNAVYLGKGWPAFFKDNNVVVGSTLSFIWSSSYTIDVQIVRLRNDKDAVNFCKEIKKHHQYRMVIPKQFVMTNGILKRGQIKLKNTEEKEWPVTVTSNGKYSFCLTGGWFDFLKDNIVVVGSTLSFSSNASDTIVVQIVEEGTDKQALFKYMANVRGCEGGHGDLNDHANMPTNRLSASDEEMDLASEE